MKSITTRVFVTVGLLAVSALSAFSQSSFALRVHVPFNFVAGKAVLPAGDYTVQQDDLSGVVMLQNVTAKTAAAVLSFNSGAALAGRSPQLVFERHNGQSVLTRIQLADQPSKSIPAGLSQLAAR